MRISHSWDWLTKFENTRVVAYKCKHTDTVNYGVSNITDLQDSDLEDPSDGHICCLSFLVAHFSFQRSSFELLIYFFKSVVVVNRCVLCNLAYGDRVSTG